MAYNKTSEERKWNYWKEQEEKKLRELGMEEEKIQKLRQMDREDFLEERRYREHLDETMQDMNSIKEKDSALFARDVKELLDHIGDKRIYELLKKRSIRHWKSSYSVHGDIREEKLLRLWEWQNRRFIPKETV